MKARKSADYTTHDEVWMLLPWYVNGSLAEKEREQVSRHLQICPACRQELAMQQRLSEAIRNTPDIRINPQSAFLRLQKRIQDGAKQDSVSTTWWMRLRPRLLQGLNGLSLKWMPRPALALGLLLLMAGILTPLWWNSISVEPHYRTLANPEHRTSDEANDIRVVFAKTMGTEQIDRFLSGIRGRIVESPSPLGVYTIRIGDPDHLTQDILAAVERLRRHPGVLLAEPVTPTGNTNPPENESR